MEKMKTVDVGLLKTIVSTQGAFNCRAITEVSFVDISTPTGLEKLHNERCYLVKKDELDAYMARKEHLEQMNCTSVFGEDQRLKARIHQLEVANVGLRDINKALEEENSKLVEKNEALVERNTSLMCENGKLRGTKNELDFICSWTYQELSKYIGVQEVIDICTTCDQGCFVLWWTGRNGDEHKLEFKLIPNSMDETMCRERHIYDTTRSGRNDICVDGNERKGGE